MSFRIHTNTDVVVGFVVNDGRIGISGSEVPLDGLDGPGLLASTLTMPADADVEFRVELLTLPSAGVFAMNTDTSFTFSDAPDGTYTLLWRRYRYNANGTVTATDYETQLIVGDTTETVGQDFTFTWAVAETVGANFSFTMSAAEAVGADFSFSMAVVEQVGQSFSAAWAVAETVGADFFFAMSAAEAVGADFSFVTPVAEFVGQDFSFYWDMEQDGVVTADFGFQWDVVSYVGQDFGFVLPVAEAVGADFAFTMSVAQSVGATFTFTWAVDGQTGGGGDCPTVDQIAAAVLLALGPSFAQLQSPIEQIQTKVDAAL